MAVAAPIEGLTAAVTPEVRVCRSEAIKTGFLLSQGGEFAFVLLSLAKELRILPDELNRLLIIVVGRPSPPPSPPLLPPSLVVPISHKSLPSCLRRLCELLSCVQR